MSEFDRLTRHYEDDGLTRRQAEREAIMDMYGDEIRAERYGARTDLDDEIEDESDENEGLDK
jgi:hypothetical protein